MLAWTFWTGLIGPWGVAVLFAVAVLTLWAMAKAGPPDG